MRRSLQLEKGARRPSRDPTGVKSMTSVLLSFRYELFIGGQVLRRCKLHATEAAKQEQRRRRVERGLKLTIPPNGKATITRKVRECQSRKGRRDGRWW
nr:unnamed protein product [Digitaria exilis]